MKSAQHTTAFVILSAFSVIAFGARQGRAPVPLPAVSAPAIHAVATDDDDFWDDMDLFRFLLCLIVPCPQMQNAPSPDPLVVEEGIKAMVILYNTEGLRPNLSPEAIAEGKALIETIVATLDAHPNTMDVEIEADYRDALTDMYDQLGN